MSSQEQISCLENILESLKGFTDEGEICTSTNMQNMLKKFLKISEKHIDEENIPLLVTCCLKYIDFLLQFPGFLDTTHSQHKRFIHNYFSVLGDIGRKMELKNIFLKLITVPILERIIDPSISSLYGRGLASNFNRIAEKSNRDLRNEIVKFSARIYIYKLTDLIETCGDYEYQTCLVQTLFRMCSSDFIIKNIKEFFPGAEDLQQRLLDIKAENFDRNLRRFLNAVNHVNNNVFSVAVSAAYLDKYFIEPPVSDDGYNMDLWVDFNVLSCTIGIFCNKNSFVTKSLSEEDEWELLTFFAADISFVELKWEKVKSEESSSQLSVIFHKCAPCHYIFYTTAEAASANVLKLIIKGEVVGELMDVLLNMFEEKFEAFKKMSPNSEVSAYYTPELSESVTTTNHVKRKRISNDGHSERSYANVLLCRNVEDKEDNLMFAQNITIETKACKKYRVFTNEMVNHSEENKENVENYSLLDREANSMVYFSCKENKKPENEWHYFSTEQISMQNLMQSTVTHDNLFKISDGTDSVVEQNKSEKLDASSECNHSASVEVVKPKKPRQKKQIKKIKIFTKLKTKINKTVKLPLIEEMPLHSSSLIKKNEKAVSYVLPNNFNPESSHEREILFHESEALTHESKPKKPDSKQNKNIAETSPTTQEQNEASCNKQKKKMKSSQEEDPKENLVQNSHKKELYGEPNQPNLRKEKQNNFENVIFRKPIVIVERSNFEEYLNKYTSQYLNDKEQTSINTEGIDDESISSSIFNVTTQQSEREDLNKSSVDLAEENNELIQKKLTETVLGNVAGKKKNESSIIEHYEEIFESSSLLNTTENELESNEINFNQPRTINIISKKRKLYNFGDLSYLETMREICSTDSEIAVSKTIVTKALVHEPVHYTLHHTQNQIIIKKIKNNVNHTNLDSINIIEGVTHCDEKQANFNKENVNDVKMQSSAQEKVNIKETEKSFKVSTPSNENNNKQCYLPNREINLLTDKSKVTTAQAELFTEYLPSTVNDNKPKKGKKSSNQKSKRKYTSGKLKQSDLQKTVLIDSFNETKDDQDLEMYIEHTSCFKKTSKGKQKSIKQKSKYDNSKVKQLKLNTVKKRKTLDYSETKPAKQKRVFNESSAVKAMTKAKQKKSNVKANRDGNDEVAEITKQRIPETAMTNIEVKSAAARVKILQNILLKPAPNSTVKNNLDEEEYVQNNNFADISQKPVLYDINSWLERGDAHQIRS